MLFMFYKGATDDVFYILYLIIIIFFNGKRGTGTLRGETKQMSLLCVNLCISASP